MAFDASLDSNPGDLLDWARNEDWGRAMAACGQEWEWHPEGDVWTHTALVVEALTEQEEWRELKSEDQHILLWAALLHDVGKPLVSRVEDGRIRSRNHGVKGAYLARRILRDREFPFHVRERIVDLVRFHNKPTNVFRSNNPDEAIARLSWQVDMPLLYILAKADTLGTDSSDKNERMDRVELFRLQAEEIDCFTAPFRSQDQHARFLYFQEQMPWTDYRGGYQPYEKFSCRVTMLSGLPGAGKDHWIRNELYHLPAVGLDDLRCELGVTATDNQGRVVQEAKKRIKKLLAAQTDFFFNATNTVWRWRRKYISLFHQYNARVCMVYIEPIWPTLLKRNKERHEAVPLKVLEDKFARLDLPSITECHEIEFVCDE